MPRPALLAAAWFFQGLVVAHSAAVQEARLHGPYPDKAACLIEVARWSNLVPGRVIGDDPCFEDPALDLLHDLLPDGARP